LTKTAVRFQQNIDTETVSKKNIGNALLTVGEMSMVLAQVEAILNSRLPLTDESMDLSVLILAYFLIRDSLTAYLELNLQDVAPNRLTQWQHVERLKQHL